VAAQLRRVLSGTLDSFQLEYPCHGRDEERWFLMTGTPLPGNDGGAVVSHMNITSRKLLERRLEQQIRALSTNSSR